MNRGGAGPYSLRIASMTRQAELRCRRGCVLVAPLGLGKTMIAQNIVHAALFACHSVLFITASQLLLDLGARDSTRALDPSARARLGLIRGLECRSGSELLVVMPAPDPGDLRVRVGSAPDSQGSQARSFIEWSTFVE